MGEGEGFRATSVGRGESVGMEEKKKKNTFPS